MKVFDVKQRSQEWHSLRRGVVTGTRLKELCGKDNLSLVDEIVGELYSDEIEELFINAKMQRGIDFEPYAKNMYMEETFNTVHEIGFCKSDKYHFLGLSPDGWVGSNGAIEIKCPDTSTHVKYIRHNKIPTDYKYQVICYFIVNEDLEWLDFVTFDNRFSLKPIHIIRITRIELQEEILEVEEKLKVFWAKVENLIEKIKQQSNVPTG